MGIYLTYAAIIIFSFIMNQSQAFCGRNIVIDDLFEIISLSNPKISPDGKTVVYVASSADFENNLYNLDLYRISSIGKDCVRLTSHIGEDNSPAWSPDGKLIAFLSNRNERAQIWIMSPLGGEPLQITQSETSIMDFAWSPDGAHIAFVAAQPLTPEQKRKNEQKADAITVDHEFQLSQLWTIDIVTKEVIQVTHGNRHVADFDWSPDGKHFVVGANPTPTFPDRFHTDIFMVPSSGGALKPLVTQRGPDRSPKWSPDGKYVAFISQMGSIDWWVNNYLCLIPAEGGKIKNLSASFDEQVRSFLWAPDGESLYFEAGAKTEIHLFRVNLQGQSAAKISDGSACFGSFHFSKAGDAAVWIRENPYTPPEVYVANINDFKPERLTFSNPQLGELRFGEVEKISWRGVDGWEIEGILVKPCDYMPGKKYPLLVIPHGGPMSVYTMNFAPLFAAYPIQVFAGEGYLIFLPNCRGSGNYGEVFRGANVRDWGGMDYKDIQAGVDFLINKGMADPEAMGIMGWSYGGYMTSWTITQTSRFKVASVGAGVTNLFSFFGVTDIPEFMVSYFRKTPWEDQQVYIQRSALFHLDKVRTPTLIQHGMEDARVPLSQGEELYIGLKKNNVPVIFEKYPREPHGFKEPRHRKYASRQNLEWFNKWIKGKTN